MTRMTDERIEFSSNEMRPARDTDLGEIIDLLEESSTWMKSIGIDRWKPGIHAAEKASLRSQIAAGTVYVWIHAGKVLATIRLSLRDDSIWSDDSVPSSYIHKMSVRRSLKGRRFGHSILQWAECQALAAGANVLRLDCWAENPRLCEFYDRCGFRRVGIVLVDGWKHQLFEKALGGGKNSRRNADRI